MKTKSNTFIKFFLIFITLTIFLSLFLLFEKNYQRIINLLDTDIESILEQNPFIMFFIFLGIFGLFNVCFVPGKSLFITIASFLINNFLYSFTLFIGCELIWTFISYPLLTYFKKESKFVMKLIDNNIFEILKKKSIESPLKICFIVQTLGIPQTFKSIFLIFSGINFYFYFISKMLVNLIYFILLIIMGMSLKSLKNLKDSEDNREDIKIKLITGFIGLSSLFLYIGILCYIKKEYNKIIKEKREKDLKTSANTNEEINNKKKDEKKNNTFSDLETQGSENFLSEDSEEEYEENNLSLELCY